MPTHSDSRHLPWTARQMYDLVADVERYPEFLPWCAGARIRSRQIEGDTEILAAELVISFKVFRERFGSRVTLRSQALRIDTEYLDGPFRYLRAHWEFLDTDRGCEAQFFVDFELKNAVLRKIIGLVFSEAMKRVGRAFEARAEALYGSNQ